MKFRTRSDSPMRPPNTFRRSRMPRPLTAESSEELLEPSSSQLAHEDEKSPQKCMIRLDDIIIERENKKRDKEDEDYIESSQGSTSTEAASDNMREGDEDSAGSSDEDVTTLTGRSQNGNNEKMDEVEVDEKTDGEPQFQSSPASSQSTQRNSGERLTPEQVLLHRYDINRRDIRNIRRFLEYDGYSSDQKKVAITAGWEIDNEGLRLVRTWIARHGDELYNLPSDW